MARGKVLDLTPKQRTDRAFYAFSTHRFIQYCLTSGRNGGFDPAAPDCGSRWQRGKQTVITSDCVGFALWAYGVDRYQKGDFPLQGGWMNTTSIVEAAKAPQIGCVVPLAELAPGCLLVYPRNLLRGRRYGHIGLYIGKYYDGIARVVHCHGPTLKGPAISADPVEKFLKVKGCLAVDIKL